MLKRHPNVVTAWPPSEVARHYDFPDDLTGKGQTIAVIDMGEPVDLQEIRDDFAALSAPAPGLTLIDLGAGQAPDYMKRAIETHIDVEIIGTLCPEAKLRIYRCSFDFKAMAEAIAHAVADGVDVISISWGAAEDSISSGVVARIEAALAQAREAGVTVCAASGDYGASGTMDETTYRPIAAPDGQPHCIYPASSPQVLACGGTEVHEVEGRRHEAVWNRIMLAEDGRGTGGGVSRMFPVPEWQAGFEVPSAIPNRRKPGRVTPDVAAVSAIRDWSFVLDHGDNVLEGGTSCAAPLFAALIAMANQRRAQHGLPRLGFVNPRLYAAAARGELFNDVTEGDNRTTHDGPGYYARKGFDACTGWGTPRGRAIVEALARG